MTKVFKLLFRSYFYLVLNRREQYQDIFYHDGHGDLSLIKNIFGFILLTIIFIAWLAIFVFTLYQYSNVADYSLPCSISTVFGALTTFILTTVSYPKFL